MTENIKIHEGKYTHVEGLTYSVIGIARLTTPTGFRGKPTFLKTALSVEGYEDTHQVTGYGIQIYRVAEDKDSSLVYVRTGNFESPDIVVVYEQLDKGAKYDIGQWWWRSIDNFKQYFTPVISST